MRSALRSRASRVAFVIVLLFALVPFAQAKTVKVDCAKGESLNAALSSTAVELIVEFSGACAEDVLIERSDVTLRGIAPDASIIGADVATDAPAALSLAGGANVALTGFTVDDQHDRRGIDASSTAALVVDGVIVTGNRHGLYLQQSASVTVRDSSFNANASDGVGIWGSSAILFSGTVSMNDNGRAGLIVSGASDASIATGGAHITAERNLEGVIIQSGSSARFDVRNADVTCTLNDNTHSGITVGPNSVWGGNATVKRSQYGFLEFGGSYVTAGSDVDVSSCELCFYVSSNSVLSANGATVSDAVYSLHVNSAHAVMIGMTLPAKVGLWFGARLGTSTDTTADLVQCDGTVLTLGPVQCPVTPAALAVPNGLTTTTTNLRSAPYRAD
jgi:hypothetical protein